MSFLLNTIINHFGDDAVRAISGKLGIENKMVQTALGAAVPLLLTALLRNSSKSEGAESLHKAVVKDHDGSILDNLSDFIPQYEQGPGGGILGHVFGEKRNTIEDLLGKTSGLQQNQAGSFLEMLAPILMGALGKEQRKNNLDQMGLRDLIKEAQEESTEKQLKGGGGLIEQFLDADGDGDIKDDLGRLAMSFLGNILKR